MSLRLQSTTILLVNYYERLNKGIVSPLDQVKPRPVVFAYKTVPN